MVSGLQHCYHFYIAAIQQVTYPSPLNVEKWLQNCEQSTLKDTKFEHIEGYISFVLCIAAGEVVNELVWLSDGKKRVSGGRKFAAGGRWWKSGWPLRRDAQPYVPVGRYRAPAIFLELRLDPQFVYIDLRWLFSGLGHSIYSCHPKACFGESALAPKFVAICRILDPT